MKQESCKIQGAAHRSQTAKKIGMSKDGGPSLILVPVDPTPTYIESSGRWKWPLPERACFPGCCTNVVTASREWWEYAPSEAKPHPMAEGVQLRDSKWYWAIPFASSGKDAPKLCDDCGCEADCIQWGCAKRYDEVRLKVLEDCMDNDKSMVAPQEPTQHTVSPVSDSPTPVRAAPNNAAERRRLKRLHLQPSAAPNNAAPRSGGQRKSSPDSQESPAAGHCEVAAPINIESISAAEAYAMDAEGYAVPQYDNATPNVPAPVFVCVSCGFEDTSQLRDGVNNHWRKGYVPGIGPTSAEAICYRPLALKTAPAQNAELVKLSKLCRDHAYYMDTYNEHFVGNTKAIARCLYEAAEALSHERGSE